MYNIGYLSTQLYIYITIIAEVAHLVEHDLAKVGVASSSLVFRSKCSVRLMVRTRPFHG